MEARRGAMLPAMDAAAVAGPPQLVAAGGALFAAATGTSVVLISPPQEPHCGPFLLKHSGSGKPIASLAMSPDGRFIAAGQSGSKAALFVWRISEGSGAAVQSPARGQPAQDIANGQHSFGIPVIAFSPSGGLLASHGAERDHQLVLWSPATGKQLGKERVRQSYDAIAFVGEESLACINKRTLVIWSLEGCTSPGGQELKLSARTWVLTPSPPTTRFIGLAAAVPESGASTCTQPRLLAATNSGRLLRLRIGEPVVEKAAKIEVGAQLLHMAATTDHLAVATSAGGIRLVSAASLTQLSTLSEPRAAGGKKGTGGESGGSGVRACAFSPDGSMLIAACASGRLEAWDLRNVDRPSAALLYQAHRFAGRVAGVTKGVAGVSTPIRKVTTAQGQPEDVAAITGAVSLPPDRCAARCQLVTCAIDGCLQLWECGTEGGLCSVARLDLRAQQSSASPKLMCLAITPDAALLAAGDSAGCVHLVCFDLQAHSGALTKLATQLVHADDITALGFAAPAASGSNQQDDAPLLAVASRRGLVKLLHVQLDGTCTLAAAMAEHTAAVTGVALLHSADSLLVFTADRGGRRFIHKLDRGTGQLRVAAQVTTPRASFVGGLAQSLCGQAVVGASKGGKLHRWDLQGREIGALQALERVGRAAGEVSCFAADPSLSLLCVASTRGQLLLFNMATGSLLVACRVAHMAGTAVSQLLFTPDCRYIVSTGHDASVCTYRVLPAVAQPPAVPDPSSGSRPLGSPCSSSGPDIQPRDLTAAIDAGAATEAAGAAEPVFTLPAAPPLPAASAEEALPPGGGDPAPQSGGAPAEQQTAINGLLARIPASPNRKALLGNREQQERQLEQLQATFAALDMSGRLARTGGVTKQALMQAPVQAPDGSQPVVCSPSAAAGVTSAQLEATRQPSAPEGAAGCGSPLQAATSVSLRALLPSSSPPANHSPDVFSDLEEPTDGRGCSGFNRAPLQLRSLSSSPPLAAATAADPTADSVAGISLASVGGGSRNSPVARGGAALPALPLAGCASGSQQHQQTLAVSKHGSVTADIGDCCNPLSSTLGSASVNQPARRRSPWGPVLGCGGGSGAPPPNRRALSALPLSRGDTNGLLQDSPPPLPAVAAQPRPHNALGNSISSIGQQATTESFTIFADADATGSLDGSDSGGASSGSSSGSGSGSGSSSGSGSGGGGSGASRRLSFSFGRPAVACGSDSKDEDTPPLPGQQAKRCGSTGSSKAASRQIPAIHLASYRSAGLPPAAPEAKLLLCAATTAASPRLALPQAAATANPAVKHATLAAEPAARTTAFQPAVGQGVCTPGTAASAAQRLPRQLQSLRTTQPAIPLLGSATDGCTDASESLPVAAILGSGAGKRKWRQCSAGAVADAGAGGSPIESSGSAQPVPFQPTESSLEGSLAHTAGEGAVSASPAASGPATATPESESAHKPASKKVKTALPSPPRLVFNCSLYSPEGASLDNLEAVRLLPGCAGDAPANGGDPCGVPPRYDPLAAHSTGTSQVSLFPVTAPSGLPHLTIRPHSSSEDSTIGNDAVDCQPAPLPTAVSFVGAAAARLAASMRGTQKEGQMVCLGPADVLQPLEQSLQALFHLRQANTHLGSSFHAQLTALTSQLQQAADSLPGAPPHSTPASPQYQSHSGNRNGNGAASLGNAGGAAGRPAATAATAADATAAGADAAGGLATDLEALKLEIKAELRRELLQELRTG
ncbi:Mitogen-activated protein kinase-binding protein 1 [Chlorella vulgaris]